MQYDQSLSFLVFFSYTIIIILNLAKRITTVCDIRFCSFSLRLLFSNMASWLSSAIQNVRDKVSIGIEFERREEL